MDTKNYVIGVDVGGSGARAGAFDLSGTLVASASQEYSPSTPGPGVVEYDARAIVDAVVATLRGIALSVDPHSVSVICVDAMMSGAVALSGDGHPVTPYTTTADSRFAPDLRRILANDGDRIRRITGSGQPTLAPKIHWMLREFPETNHDEVVFALAGAFVCGQLTGLPPDSLVVDDTVLWTTGLADTAARKWSRPLLDSFAIKESSLPRIGRPADIAGHLTRELALHTGLRSGTPIAVGCGDQPAGFLGSGSLLPHRGADCAGSYSVVAAVTQAFDVHQEVTAPDVLPTASGEMFSLQSMVIGGGLTERWAHALLGLSRRQSGSAMEGVLPGARGVRFVPHMGGEAYPVRPGSNGAWVGLNWAHSAADLYQAVLEGIAIHHARAFAAISAMYPDTALDSISVYGGGAANSNWNQIKADATGLVYECIENTQPTSLGAAMVGAEAVGLIRNAAEHCADLRTVKERFHPRPEAHSAFLKIAEEYDELSADIAEFGERRVATLAGAVAFEAPGMAATSPTEAASADTSR